MNKYSCSFVRTIYRVDCVHLYHIFWTRTYFNFQLQWRPAHTKYGVNRIFNSWRGYTKRTINLPSGHWSDLFNFFINNFFLIRAYLFSLLRIVVMYIYIAYVCFSCSVDGLTYVLLYSTYLHYVHGLSIVKNIKQCFCPFVLFLFVNTLWQGRTMILNRIKS